MYSGWSRNKPISVYQRIASAIVLSKQLKMDKTDNLIKKNNCDIFVKFIVITDSSEDGVP